MNMSEAATVLTFCAAYDQRTIGDADVAAWREALDCPWVPNISLDEAQCAVVAHYRCTAERIAPADVIKAVRDERAATFGHTALPATEGAAPPAEYIAARLQFAAAFGVKPDGERHVTPVSAERRRLVLSHPEVAKRLCLPPLDYDDPTQWSGYLPPETHDGKRNRSPQREALLAILAEAEAADAAMRAALATQSTGASS